MRLDLVEHLEGALDIERVELVERHAIGEQRLLDRVDRVLAQGAAARETSRR
jgi:hypothetical protein